MENNTVVTENVQPAEVGSELTTEQLQEEQNARERYQKSVNPDADTSTVPEGYNPDGTPIEETEEVDWATKYQELELEHKLATNPNVYKTEQGVFDATDIIEEFKQTGVLSDEQREDLLSTGLTNEQIDEAINSLKGSEPTTTANDVSTSFNVKKYETELATTGVLSEDSYAELAKYGFSKNDVDVYIQGQREIANQFISTIHNIAGGQEEYADLINWSSQNLDKVTIDRYNEAIKTNDREAIKSIIEFAKFKRDGSEPKKPNRLEGTSGGSSGFAPFKDKNDWQRAQTNKLYGRDAKYTNMVDARYLASRRQGIL